MTTEIIREYGPDGNWTEKTVDCSPVEKFIEKLESDLRAGAYNNKTWQRIDALKALDHEQLLRAAILLLGVAVDYAQGYDFLLTRDGMKATQDLLAIRDAATEQGFDLWPELDGKRKED